MSAIGETAGAAPALADLLRRHDRDRYLMALFAPAEKREAIMALYAFNFEVARVREIVTETMLGRIRLQWWREGIAAAFGDAAVRNHEVLTPLATAIRRHDLERRQFERLIDARERDLADHAPATVAELEGYAVDTNAPLQALALDILGVEDEEAARAVREAATAYGLAGLLRATPFLARRRRSILPRALVEAIGLDLEALFAGRGSVQLGEIVSAIASRAMVHLNAACALRRQVPRAALPALLPGVLAAADLRRLRRAGHDVFAPSLQRPDPLRSWRLAWAMLRGRY